MILESKDRKQIGVPRYKKFAETIKDAFDLAVSYKMIGFRLYDANGCFLSEYALFDGKYRRVENAIR